MQRIDPRPRGFSLMEVTTALGVISFALVALLGIFPLGLENSRVSVSETRASQLTKMVYSTLATEMSVTTGSPPVSVVRCFSTTLDPLTLGADGSDASTLTDVTTKLYVSYLFKGQQDAPDDADGQPVISRNPAAATTATYIVDLTFHPKAFTPPLASASGAKQINRLTGYNVDLSIRGLNKAKPFFETTSFVPSFNRAAYTK